MRDTLAGHARGWTEAEAAKPWTRRSPTGGGGIRQLRQASLQMWRRLPALSHHLPPLALPLTPLNTFSAAATDSDGISAVSTAVSM